MTEHYSHFPTPLQEYQRHIAHANFIILSEVVNNNQKQNNNEQQ